MVTFLERRCLFAAAGLVLVMLAAINPVGALGASFGASPSSVEVTAGGSVSTTMTLTHTGSDWVGQALVCNGLPTGASCSTWVILPGTVFPAGPPFTFTVTISTSPSTPPGTYTVAVVLTYTVLSPIISPGFEISPGISKVSASGGIGPASISIQQVSSVSTDITLTIDPAVIPEYPLGLPILAIFMVLTYGVIRRRTKNPKCV